MRENLTNHDAERFEKANTLAGEYIGMLGAYVKEGAKVTLPGSTKPVERAA